MSNTKDELIAKYPYVIDIIERIRILLKEKGLSQRKFADEIGVHPGHVSKMMSMQCLPSATILFKLAFNGYDLNYIVTGKEGDDNSEYILELEKKLELANHYTSKLEQLIKQ